MYIPLRKLAIAGGLAVAMLAGMSISPAGAATDTAPGQNLSRKVAALADSNTADAVKVIVVYKSKPDQSEKQRVKALGGKAKHDLKKLSMLTLSVPAKKLKALANNPKIKIVTADEPVFGLSVAARETGNLPTAGSQNSVYADSGSTEVYEVEPPTDTLPGMRS